MDVGVAGERLLDALERLVGLQAHAARTRDERIARDARLGVVGLAEAAVDDEQATVCADGLLALLGLDRRVPVDDMAVPGHEPEFPHDRVARVDVVRQLEVGVHGLLPGGPVVDVGALEGLDDAPGDRRLEADPQVPHPVERLLAAVTPCLAGDVVAEVEVVPAGAPGSHAVHAGERAVLVHGHASMEEEVAVAREVDRAVAVEELDMAAEAVVAGELVDELVDDALLLIGQAVGVLGPELKIRVVNVVDLFKLESNHKHPHGLSDSEYNAIFTTDKPVIFAFHGYPTLIHELTYRRDNQNVSVHGYQEEGTITTPFDMRVQNEIDRFNLVKDAIMHLPQLANRGSYLIQKMNDKLVEHKQYIAEYGQDLEEVRDWEWHSYAFNLEFAQVKNTNGFIGKQVVEYRFVPGQMIGGKSDYGYLFTNVEFYTPKVMYELLRKGIHVQASNRPFHFRSGDIEKEMGYGTILVSAWNQPVSSDELYELLSKLAKESGVDIYAATTGLMQDVDLGSPAYTALKLPKVAILVGRTMGVPDSGEAWFLLDRRFQMRPTLIEATATLTSRKLSRYNVIILANGIPDLTKESEKALKDWVANGGTLIASGKAYSWVDKSGILPISVKDASFKEDSTRYRAYSEKKEAAAGNSISGVILSCSLDSSHPLAWGLEQPEIAVLKKGNLIFEKDSDPYVSPLHYTEKPLLSGFLSEKNESLLRNTPAVFAKKYKSGAVFVFADDLNFRSYYFGTSKLFMNAVFFGECL